MRPSFWNFLSQQWTKYPVVTTDLTGKTVIVLGANTGLGFEAAKHFAAMNPGRLILACRSESKGNLAVEQLKAATGYAKAELRLVDLSEFESTTKFADDFERDGGRLDILVANAGLATEIFEPTKDGWESSLQVNHLSTALVALRLLPSMIRTAQQHDTAPRLVVIEKKVAENPDMLETLGSPEYCASRIMAARYPLTKLLNVFFVRALNSNLMPSTPVIVNAVNPGFCRTGLTREVSGVRALMVTLMGLVLGRTAEEGSRQLVWAAVGNQEQPDKLRGEYINGCKVQESSDYVLSADGVKAQNRLWDETIHILSKVDGKVTKIVEEYLSPVQG
ncbi:hypothetical protein C8R46DRAFT_1071525 [Mycena filopes]|nr:hypothetical protein C8R46DRAFT_1071525 [Mycena filopes]